MYLKYNQPATEKQYTYDNINKYGKQKIKKMKEENNKKQP